MAAFLLVVFCAGAAFALAVVFLVIGPLFMAGKQERDRLVDEAGVILEKPQ